MEYHESYDTTLIDLGTRGLGTRILRRHRTFNYMIEAFRQHLTRYWHSL